MAHGHLLRAYTYINMAVYTIDYRCTALYVCMYTVLKYRVIV